MQAAAVAGPAIAGAAERAEVADGVGIHRYRAGSRQGPAVQNGGFGVEGDARQRNDIAFKGRRGPERRGTADLPKQAVIGAAIGTEIDHLNRRVAGGRQRAADLEDPVGVVAALGVEREGSRQLGRRVEMIDARHQRESTEIVTGQVTRERHARQTNVRRGGIDLRLLCDGIRLVYGSRDRDARQARDRSPRRHPQISGDGGRAGIGHRRGAQNRETRRCAQNTREHAAILQALQTQQSQRPAEAFRDRGPAGALAGPGFSKQPGEQFFSVHR